MGTHSKEPENGHSQRTVAPRQTSLHGLWPDVACLAILGGLLLVFFWRFLTPDPTARILFPDGDFIDQFFPWRHYASFELAQGRLPLWTPFANSGHPFMADIQSAVLYPPHLLLALLLRLRGDPQLMLLDLESLAVFHFFLAGAFTYLFVRQQTGNRAAALAGGLIFTFGSYLTTYPALQLAILETAAWTPLALLLVASAVSRKSPVLWAALGVVLAVAVLAGHPQQAAYLYYLVAAFAIFTILTSAEPGSGSIFRRPALYLPHLGGLLLAFGISVGVASAQLLLSWDLISLSSRTEDLSYLFTRDGFGLLEAFGLVFPDLLGGKPFFLGSVPVLLVTMSLFRPRLRGTVFWFGAAAVAFLLSFGGNLPFYEAAHCCIPGFSMFRGQERAVSVLSLAGSILSGYGLASALTWSSAALGPRLRIVGRIALIASGITALAAIFGFGTELLDWPFHATNLGPDAAAAAIVFGVAGLTVYLWRIGRLSRTLAAAGLVALATTQLLAANWSNFEPGGKSGFDPTPLTSFLQTLPQSSRIELTALPTNLGYVFRLRSTRGAGPLAEKYYANVMERSGPWKAWQLLNTGYVVNKGQGSDSIFAYGDYRVDRTNYDTLPAYVSFRPQVETNDDVVLASLEHPGGGPPGGGFVLGRDALLSEGLDSGATGSGYVRSLEVTPDDGGHLTVRVDVTQPGVLVLSEVYFPGWRALLDGRETRIVRTNYLLRGIAIPAGPHVVEMAYQPDSFKAGSLVSLGALFVILCIVLVSLRLRARWKVVATPLLLAVTLGSALIFWHGYSSFARDAGPGKWQEMSRFLEANQLPGDSVVIPRGNPPNSLRLPAGMSVIPPSDAQVLPKGARLWWLSSPQGPDPGPGRPRPAQGFQVVSERWFGDQLLSLMTPPEAVLGAASVRLDAVLDNRIALRGYSTSVDKGDQGGSGVVLKVFLYWQAIEDIGADYTVFVHLLDSNGKIISQDDAPPAGGGRQTSGWEVKEAVTDWHVLSVPQGVPEGNYSLIAGLYDARDGKRLGDGVSRDFVPLGQVTLSP
ncbi:MAG: YfhO family protein [Dehalococcoidia bacterium]|nr:YfhO family protein [Dehalococcoidia bacterium]